jgi:hypothetical protein
MTSSQPLVSRTRRHWLATAHALRERHPELAAKITLARLADRSAHLDELLTIPFTCAEYDRLLARLPALAVSAAPDQTIADIEAFLGCRPVHPRP